MVEVRALGLPDVKEVRPIRHEDDRGFFVETWNRAAFGESGIDIDFVQDNHSMSRTAGVLRGLHYQLGPSAQAKLVRVTRGAIFDVAVDVRRSSPTFGRWVGLRVSADQGNQMFVPVGFAHGFVTLEAECEVQYKASAQYDPAMERAIRWDDPAIAIDWPIDGVDVTLSGKDRGAPTLADAETFQ
jgi:dTDP-4-dehydrorhamnose 3,5-epimerase